MPQRQGHYVLDVRDCPDQYERQRSPIAWAGCFTPSRETLRDMVQRCAYGGAVWEDEGHFIDTDLGRLFIFNDKHIGFEPLLIDVNTARLFVACFEQYEDGSEKRTGNMNKALGHRGLFGEFASYLWSQATFGRQR